MGGVLRPQRGAHRHAQGVLAAGVLASLALQDAHRIVPFASGTVQPSFDRRDTEAYRLAGTRMAPLAQGELLKFAAQHARRRRRGQQVTENRSCAQRSWIREPSPLVMPAPLPLAPWCAP